MIRNSGSVKSRFLDTALRSVALCLLMGLLPGATQAQDPDIFGGSEEALDDPGAIGNDEIDRSYNEAKQLMDHGEFTEAVKKFGQVLELNPRHFPACYERGLCFFELGHDEMAVQSLSQAAVYGRSFPKVFLERGKVYLHLKRFREAAEDFRVAYQLDPTNPVTAYHCGLAEFQIAMTSVLATARAESFAESEKFLTLALNGDDTFGDAYYHRALARVELGKTAAAKRDMQLAMEHAPESKDFRGRIATENIQLRQANLRLRDELEELRQQVDLGKEQSEKNRDEVVDLLAEIRDILAARRK